MSGLTTMVAMVTMVQFILQKFQLIQDKNPEISSINDFGVSFYENLVTKYNLIDDITKSDSSSVSMTAKSPPCDWKFVFDVNQLASSAFDIQ